MQSRGWNPLSGLNRLTLLLENLLAEWYPDLEITRYVQGSNDKEWLTLSRCEEEAAKGCDLFFS
jgi:hypothetical protein